MIKKIYFAVLLSGASVAHAEVKPLETNFDTRIQTVHYNPDDVVRVSVKIGVSTLIQLEKDEYLVGRDGKPDFSSGLGMGDPLAWSVSVRGPNIFIRPIGEQPDTNVTLVSNKRTYVFSLESVKGRQAPSWLVRFVYPQAPVSKPAPKGMPCNSGAVNRSYEVKGDSTIAPVKAWDDGRFTCLKFQNASDLPAVYWKWTKEHDGKEKEGLVNMHMEKDVMVIHQIAPEFRIRLGDKVAGLRTNSSFHMGYNNNGTTNGLNRELVND